MRFLPLRSLAFATAATLTLAFGGAVSPAVAAPAYAEWFQHDETVTGNWVFSEVMGESNRVRITRRDASDEPAKKIFVLYSKPSSAYAVAISKILEIFEAKGMNVEFEVYNYSKDDIQGERALKIAEESNSDLVFSMGSASTAWLWDNYRGGQVPVVSVCSKDPVTLGQIESYDVGTGTNFAFTSLNMPIEVQMAYLQLLKPELKNLGVLVDSSNVSAVETQAKPIADLARERGVQVHYLAVEDTGNAKQELATLVRNAVTVMRQSDENLDHSVFWITGSTSVFREIETINEHADRVPVLSVVPEVVQEGANSAVLSIGVSFESNAHLAAIYGADVLEGRAKAGELKVGIVSPPDIAINFRKARQITLDIPFTFFESASTVYDYEGRLVRYNGKSVVETN